MRRPQIVLPLALPATYVAVVLVLTIVDGEAQMLRLALDWPITLATDNCDWLNRRWDDMTAAIGWRSFAPLDTAIVAVVYAGLGYLIGLVWTKMRSPTVGTASPRGRII